MADTARGFLHNSRIEDKGDLAPNDPYHPRISLDSGDPQYYFALGLERASLHTSGGDAARMKKPIQRDLFPGALEIMILRTLKRQPMHGYALVQQIKRTSNDLLQIEEGSLYPALQRLLKENFVKAEWGISSTNRRVRIYQLTTAGGKHLEREVSSFERMLKGITQVLAPGEL
jgi:PadR family transcriptional regulator, regulatory protein PadR